RGWGRGRGLGWGRLAQASCLACARGLGLGDTRTRLGPVPWAPRAAWGRIGNGRSGRLVRRRQKERFLGVLALGSRPGGLGSDFGEPSLIRCGGGTRRLGGGGIPLLVAQDQGDPESRRERHTGGQCRPSEGSQTFGYAS